MLTQLCELNQPIYEAMLLKESFVSIYTQNPDIDIKEYLLSWMQQATASNLKPFQELASKLIEKMDYILNWFKQKVSSAISEGFNNKIKRLKRMAYGYKDIDYFLFLPAYRKGTHFNRVLRFRWLITYREADKPPIRRHLVCHLHDKNIAVFYHCNYIVKWRCDD